MPHLAGIGNVDNDNAALGIRVISPIPNGVILPPAQDEQNSVVNGGGREGGEDDFPSKLTCLINQEPPAVAVFFDIPDANGQISGQVFEESALYRFITQLGVANAFRSVRHPGSGVFIRRDQALAAVRRVPPEVQERISAER